MTSYTLDKETSRLGFQVTKLFCIPIPGAWTDFSGSLTFDPNNDAACNVTAVVKVASLNTREAACGADGKRDEHTTKMLDVEKFPEMKFVSTKVEKDVTGYKVTGDLTIRGITKTYTFVAEDVKTSPGKIEMTVTGEVKRSDFEMQPTGPISDLAPIIFKIVGSS